MADQTGEIIILVVTMIFLLLLLYALHEFGVLDPITVSYDKVPQLLVATQPVSFPSRPEATPEMADIAMIAASHGLTENLDPVAGKPTRGYFYGKFLDVITKPSFKSTTSHHGVVLESDDLRVNEDAQEGWQKRLSKSPNAPQSLDVAVRIVPGGPALMVSTVERTGNFARAIACWRLMRRMKKRIKEYGLRSPVVSVFVSPRKREISFAIMGVDPTANSRASRT